MEDNSKNQEPRTNFQTDEPLAAWPVHAYERYERGAFWYIAAGVIIGGLLVTAFVTYNFLLAALVVMVAVVLILQGAAHPPVIDVEIGPLGIRRGKTFFPYAAISHFWIIYDPPLKSLYFTVPRSITPTIHVPIDDQDPTELRELLKRFIKEDANRDTEPLLDSLARILKI